MASASSSCKDLLERISPGSPQDLLLRTCTGSCKAGRNSRISTRARLCENLQWKCRRPRAWEPRGADFARACAVEMHMGKSQEQFYARIYRKTAAGQMACPDLYNSGLNTYCKDSSVWTHCLGKNWVAMNPTFLQYLQCPARFAMGRGSHKPVHFREHHAGPHHSPAEAFSSCLCQPVGTDDC